MPDYLLPQGMRVGQDPSAKKRKRRRAGKKRAQGQGTDRQRRKDNDPLQNFEDMMDDDQAGGAEDGNDDYDGGEEEEEVDPLSGPVAVEDRIYHNGEDLGKSSAGRDSWKQRHKKGKYSTKPRVKRELKKFIKKG